MNYIEKIVKEAKKEKILEILKNDRTDFIYFPKEIQKRKYVIDFMNDEKGKGKKLIAHLKVINSLSKEEQLEKLKSEPHIFPLILKPTKEMTEIAVKKYGKNIKYVDNPTKTLFLMAIENDAKAAQFVDIELNKEEITYKMIDQYPEIILNLKPNTGYGLIEYSIDKKPEIIFEKNKIKSNFIFKNYLDLSLRALKNNPSLIVKYNKPSLQELEQAFKNGSEILSLLSPKLEEKYIVFAAVKQDAKNIKHVPDYFMNNNDLFSTMIETNPEVLAYLPKEKINNVVINENIQRHLLNSNLKLFVETFIENHYPHLSDKILISFINKTLTSNIKYQIEKYNFDFKKYLNNEKNENRTFTKQTFIKQIIHDIDKHNLANFIINNPSFVDLLEHKDISALIEKDIVIEHNYLKNTSYYDEELENLIKRKPNVYLSLPSYLQDKANLQKVFVLDNIENFNLIKNPKKSIINFVEKQNGNVVIINNKQYDISKLTKSKNKDKEDLLKEIESLENLINKPKDNKKQKNN